MEACSGVITFDWVPGLPNLLFISRYDMISARSESLVLVKAEMSILMKTEYFFGFLALAVSSSMPLLEKMECQISPECLSST